MWYILSAESSSATKGCAVAELVGRRILVVEHDTLVGELLKDMLAELECEIASVPMAARTFVEADLDDIDAATLDIGFESMAAFPIATMLAERNIPFVFTVGTAAPWWLGRFADYPVLRKPFALCDLEQALASVLTAGNDTAPADR
jgi:DNA-binding response OmpR family regulator